jgi:proline iminopeptidase
MRLPPLLSAAVLLTACGSPFFPDGDGELFYVLRDGARMPVWVRGQPDADTFIVVLHGGPGSTGTQYVHMGAFRGLEERYGVVLFEQRVSGFSQGVGGGGREVLGSEHLAHDVEAVIDVVIDRYRPETVVLLGHSWGGVLGTAYLALEPSRQDALDGWIEVNGAHNWRLGQDLSAAWVQDRARAFLADEAPTDLPDDHWREVLTFYEEHPVGDWEASDPMWWIRRHVVHVDEADGYFLPENDHIEARLDEVTGLGWQSAFAFSNPWAWFQDDRPPIWEREYDRTAAIMDRITLPTLVVWGRHDGILPVALADDAYDRLGTPPSDKEVLIFEETAHSPMFEQPDAFDAAVIDFVERVRR